MKKLAKSHEKNGQVIFSFLSVVFLSMACGNNDNDSNDGLILTIEYDPAAYYTIIDECSKGLRGGSETSYNAQGSVISEKVCVADSAAKLLKVTEKELKGTTLEIASYTETSYNDNGRPVNVKKWNNTDKSELTNEYSFTYADGKLTQSVYKFGLGNTVETTDYNELEEPVKETTIYQLGSSSSTAVSTCLLFRDYQPCEKTKDGQVQESLEQVGEEFIKKELINDTLIETERFSLLNGDRGLYKKRVFKSYSSDGNLSYEEEGNCTLVGSEAKCSETTKTAAGKTFFTQNSTFKNVGKVKTIVGSVAKEGEAFIEVASTFTALTKDKEYSGGFNSVFDNATLNSDSESKIETKAAAHPDLESVYTFLPYWMHMSSQVNEIFSESITTGSVTFNSIVRYNAQKEQILTEVTSLTGLTPEQIATDFVYKEVSTYEQ